jgi:glycosyltransferase involved in cell wall biosynthesis
MSRHLIRSPPHDAPRTTRPGKRGKGGKRRLIPSGVVPGERVQFFARVWDPHLLEIVEFYSGDIAALKESSGDGVILEHQLWPALRNPGDASFAWWWASALPIVIQARLLHRPVVVTGAINNMARSSLKGRLRDRFKRLLVVAAMRLATTNIVISDYELATAARLGARRVTRLYPGIDTEYFCPGPKSPSPTAVTAAQLFPIGMRRKGVDVSIEAAALVRQSVPDFRLTVIGPVFPDGQEYLDQLRETLDFSGVDVLGEVTRDEKRRLFSSAWTYLQPSLAEGFGLAMAEAMAAGTVPVCSGCGALPEVVGRAGVIVENATAQSVADAIVHLIRDDAERGRLSAAARERARDFDSRARTVRFREILTEAGWPVGPPIAPGND